MATLRWKRIPAIPGIPSAPIGKDFLNDADWEYEKRKKKLGFRLPIMSGQQVVEKNDAFHVNILHTALVAGYYKVVNEIDTIVKSEEHDRKIFRIAKIMNPLNLMEQKPKLKYLVEVLKYCQDEFKKDKQNGNYHVTVLRKECAEKFLREKDLWLAKYMFQTALKHAQQLIGGKQKKHLLAEIHCLVAFVIRESEESAELALEEASTHLTECRMLSEGKMWLLKAGLLLIKIKKPIAMHGLREEYTSIEGNSMVLHSIACLLQHEMFLAVANYFLHHKVLTGETLKLTDKYLNSALELAYLVKLPIALISSLMRFGHLLRHTGDFDKAIQYFQLLVRQAMQAGDSESIAIGYNEIGLCYLGKLDIIAGLEYLITEKDHGEACNLIDIQADSLQHIGHVLLQEGHLWEAEECYFLAYNVFQYLQKQKNRKTTKEKAKIQREEKEFRRSLGQTEEEDEQYDSDLEDEATKRMSLSMRGQERKSEASHHSRNYCERDFVLMAIGAGEKLWSQFVGLVIDEDPEILEDIVEWKNYRKELPQVPRPNYNTFLIEEVYRKPTEKEDGQKCSTARIIRSSIISRTSSEFKSRSNFVVQSRLDARKPDARRASRFTKNLIPHPDEQKKRGTTVMKGQSRESIDLIKQWSRNEGAEEGIFATKSHQKSKEKISNEDEKTSQSNHNDGIETQISERGALETV